ncbi:MAG: carbon-nitrogen hydrolase family protein [Clostridiales Family XIII bacterium]|jgi:predicted amidohydrolase|nr:carbon-nitrogen hydrolase family protein [Clostridiales Family XIII bacterium]
MCDNNVKYTLALCQFASSEDKDESFEKASRFVGRASAGGARVVAMPEMWNCPYGNEYFSSYAEEEGDLSFGFMADLARTNEVYLVGGSIPERADGAYYNTSFIFSPGGDLIGKHRKAHLFDIDIEGGPSFRESDTLSAGDGVTVFDTEFGKMGVAICFDVRFAGMFSDMAAAGCHLVVLPAAFTLATGAAHWELLIRSRALDNQFYFAACAPARMGESKFRSWAHSMIADPWGDLRAAAATEETVIFGEIDRGYMDKVRREVPVRGR